MKNVVLYYNDLSVGGTSDKEYRTQIVKNGSGYQVTFQFGRRGGTLQSGVKTNEPVTLEEAEAIFDKLVREKTSKGYRENHGETSAAPTILTQADTTKRTPYPQEELEEVGPELAEALIKDDRYLMQVKANGHFRQGEKRADGTVISYNKLGIAKPFPPAVEKELAALPLKTFFVDGELVGELYIVFQMLQKDGKSLTELPYAKRLKHAEDAVDGNGSHIKTVSTWTGTKAKQGGIALCRKNRLEGVCFKLKDAPYHPGATRVHKKLKFLKQATFRVLALGVGGHNNARLGLLENGKWVGVGGSSMIGKDKRIHVGSLVEVRFLYMTEDRRIYQPRIERLRDDVSETECTFERQIKKHMYQGAAA